MRSLVVGSSRWKLIFILAFAHREEADDKRSH